MNTTTETKCVNQFTRIGRVLLWGGLGVCIAAATLYDIRYWVFG